MGERGRSSLVSESFSRTSDSWTPVVNRKSRWVSFIIATGGYSRFIENPHQSNSAALSGLCCLGSTGSMDSTLHLKTFLSRMSGPHMATGVALPIPV